MQLLTEVESDDHARVSCGVAEFDRVLGSGLVRDGLVLVRGAPGSGKSTLILQAFPALAHAGERALYVPGEESARQVRMRAEWLQAARDNLYVLAETRLSCKVPCSSPG